MIKLKNIWKYKIKNTDKDSKGDTRHKKSSNITEDWKSNELGAILVILNNKNNRVLGNENDRSYYCTCSKGIKLSCPFEILVIKMRNICPVYHLDYIVLAKCVCKKAIK